MDEAKPFNLDQAMNGLNWLAGLKEEFRLIEKNKAWELVEKPVKKPIDVKWVYKVKRIPNVDIAKHKARLVARGFL